MRNSARRILRPAVAYARSLSPSRTCRFRCLSQWPHPRWSDLSARFYSNHAWFGSAEAFGLGAMAIWRHDRLHLGWGGMRGGSGPLQLSSRNYPASPHTRLIATTANVRARFTRGAHNGLPGIETRFVDRAMKHE